MKKLWNGLKSVVKTEEIEFLCFKEDVDVIPKPFPSNQYVPDWFKYLPAKVDKKDKLENSTIKRCSPFLDTLTMGWIIPLCADVEIITSTDGSGFNSKSFFYRTVIEGHTLAQLGTNDHPNPESPKPPMKFMNYWLCKVPPGYSLLFTPPLNRPDPRFSCFSGVVDCDGYFEFVNFPFFFHEKNFTGIIKAGTPLVQVIPFKRTDLLKKGSTRQLDQSELEEIDLTRRKRKSHESHYRDNVWEKK